MAKRSEPKTQALRPAGSTGQPWRQLELALDLDVDEAMAQPEGVDLNQLVQRFDHMLAALPERQLLRYGGLYLDRLSALYHARAMALLDDWEEEYNHEGPRFDMALLDGLIREHHSVDVSEFVKPASRFRPLQPSGPVNDEDSVFLELDTEQAVHLAEQDLDASKNRVNLSHEEDISGWIHTVEQSLSSMETSIRLLELYQQTSLDWVELLLALLLGGFELQQTGSFYQADSLWVVRGDRAAPE